MVSFGSSTAGISSSSPAEQVANVEWGNKLRQLHSSVDQQAALALQAQQSKLIAVSVCCFENALKSNCLVSTIAHETSRAQA